MADIGASLDGLGLLAGVQPTPTRSAILQAKVQTEQGIETLYVLTISTPSGVCVTYWNRDALDTLARSLVQALTGIEVAHSMPPLEVVRDVAH